MQTGSNRLHGRQALFLTVLIVCLFWMVGCGAAQAEPSAAQFDRPYILHNTVCTARGTPLRGTTISTEGNRPGEFIMTAEEMAVLTRNGLNALHIYAERYSDGLPVGASALNCDSLIEEAARNGIVVVLTMGEMNMDPAVIEEEIEFLYEFWAFYAERYKDKQNVIFEICNEVPLTDSIAEVEANAYEIIRERAPDTMVLFYSFALTDQIDVILAAIAETERRIGDESLWNNAAIAFHSYECQEDQRGADAFRSVIHSLTRKGYPIINTELPNRFELSCYPDPALIRVCEEEGISWLSFVFWSRIDTPSIWRGQLEAAGITWVPDFGAWPIAGSIHPFTRQYAWDTAGLTPADSVKEHRFHAYRLRNGEYVDLRRLNFGEREPLAFQLYVKSTGAGRIFLREKDESGPILGTCAISDTGGDYVNVSGFIDTPISGTADVCFVYASEENRELCLAYWQFMLPDQAEYSDLYSGPVHAANYPYRTGDILREACTDSQSEATHQVGNITNGSSLLFDFVGFTGEKVEFHVRAKSLAGGTVSIYAGDNRDEIYELGHCVIDGPSGEWAEYIGILDQDTILMFDPVLQYWNLTLCFGGDEAKELFAISDFWFDSIS